MRDALTGRPGDQLANLLRRLPGASAEDCRALADQIAPAWRSDRELSPGDQAKLALVMMRWVEIDPGGAVEWGTRRALSGNVSIGLAPFTAWARLDPEAAGDAMRESPSRWIAQCGPRVLAGYLGIDPNVPEGGEVARTEAQGIADSTEWEDIAKTDPRRAVTLAVETGDPLAAGAKAWAALDPAGFRAFATSVEGTRRRYLFETLARHYLVSGDPLAAWELYRQGETRQTGLEAALLAFSGEARTAAFELVARSGDFVALTRFAFDDPAEAIRLCDLAPQDAAARLSAIRSVIQANPAAVAEIVGQIEGETPRRFAAFQVAQLLESEAKGSGAAWAARQSGEIASAAQLGLAIQSGQLDLAQARQAFAQLPAEMASLLSGSVIRANAPASSPAELLAFAAEFPPADHSSASYWVDRWVRDDPAAASRWAVGLPDSRLRESAAAALSDHLVGESDFYGAIAWARTIGYEAHRTERLNAAVSRWQQSDPEGFAAALPGLDLPPEYAADLIYSAAIPD
ncbi:MAG: hypothetical protein R3F11_20025 [Verrucomicrobiales bacterium]